MYECIKRNAEAMLGALNIGTIDGLFFWQGENPTAWAIGFERLMDRLKGESWFPATTPVLLFGLSFNLSDTNSLIQAAASREPDLRLYVFSSKLGPEYWDLTSGNIHMLAPGYELLGSEAAKIFLDGPWPLPWTPSGNGVDLQVYTASRTKRGSEVSVDFLVVCGESDDDETPARVKGLPFKSGNDVSGLAVTYNTCGIPLILTIDANSDYVRVRNAATGADLTNAQMSQTALSGSGRYHI